MNLAAVLLTGLLAGGVSCAAVQGGLLTGLVARQKAASKPAKQQTARVNGSSTTATALHWRAQLAEVLAPVTGFLAGKLASHALLGALLGALGTVVQLSPHTRATMQLLAGALIVAFGLAQLKVLGFRGFTITPPESWVRFLRGRARSASALAPPPSSASPPFSCPAG